MADNHKLYEATLLLESSLIETEAKGIGERFEALVKEDGGVVVEVDVWGKRRLAYEINDQRDAYYLVIVFSGSKDLPKSLEAALKMEEGIIRFLLASRVPTAEAR